MIGTTLGPYRIDAELGSGGMGQVWRATVEGRAPGLEVGTTVALKVVHPHLLGTPVFLKRFLREAEIGKRVVHENVVRTYDAAALMCEGRQVHFLVMEYVEGRTLRELLAELERVPEELCRHVGREVAKGLAAIHAAGVVHRDMKPENVLITKGHVVKVMDLGVARLVDESLRVSQTGAFVGSVLYTAPEQFRDPESVDGRADLHALGLILYELSTAQHPYRADDFAAVMRRVLDEKPRRPAEINPQLSPFFEELVLRLLAKKREERFASGLELARILDEGETSAWWKERAIAIRAATRRPLRRIRIPRETALHGREADLARLRAVYERAKAGDGRVVLVEGEAGIGKSRLVDEFVGLLQGEGEDLNFLFGSYPPGGAATASGAFSTAYREQFGEGGSAENLKATPILVAAFDALLRGESTPAGVEPLTKDSLQTVFVHATRSLAAERTTIVLIEDLHFAPEEGRALFAALALAVPGHRILLVGTTRPGLDEKWLASIRRLDQVTGLALARLSPADLARLLVDAFRSERLAQELSFKIAEKSDGNPFFVFEILRGLREGQFITRKDDGTWVTTRAIAEIQVPSSVLDLVQARISDLGGEDRNVLEAASCLGFEFDPAVVGAVLCVAPIPLLQRLGQIETRHRLVRSAGRRFVFDHHQVQESLYGGLSELLREEYHAAIGSALEARSGVAAREPKDLDGALCVDLSDHFLKGGQGRRALRYLDAALTHLERGYLNEAAVGLADRALAVPGLLAGRERAEILVRKAERLDFLGRRDAERAALDEARPLADAAGDAALRVRVLRVLGGLLKLLSRPQDAEAVLRESRTLARAAGNRKEEAAAISNMGTALKELGRLAEAKEHGERALALAREIGDRGLEAEATLNLGAVFMDLGRHAEARKHGERGLALARETGNRRGESVAAGNLGITFCALGRYDEARAHQERSLALAREIGDRAGEACAATNLGILLASLGRLAEAKEHFERHLALAREIGAPGGEARATGNLGIILGSLGRPAEAREHLARYLATAREIGDRALESAALQSLGDRAQEEGDAPAAERSYAEALALQREIGLRGSEAETLCARGSLLARLDRNTEARADLGAALALARELSLPGVELVATAWLAWLAAGDVGPALAALATLEQRADVVAAMQARFLLWQSTRDPVHLSEAKRRLDPLVAHAPADCRESMLAHVRLHREIAAAAREAGL